MALTILTAVLLLLYALLISFYHRHWQKLKTFEPVKQSPNVVISVVTAARNEEKNIQSLLNDISQQNYPTDFYEVIVVDDFSTDKTAEIIRHNFPAVKLLTPRVPASESSKKAAISAGVSNARGELIVVTDADCKVKQNWLQTIAAFYNKNDASFIAAPVKFSNDGSLLQKFQALDFLILQGITAASVSSGFHNMCNGANLAYTKKSFEESGGFEGISSVASGDDMLLMHKIWKLNPKKVLYLKSEHAIVTTEPMKTWTEFFMQRRRWASKNLVYEDKKIIFVLAFVYLFNLFFLVLLIAAFFNLVHWWLPLSYLVVKPLIETPFVFSVSKFYDERKVIPYLFLFQPIHIFYTVFVGLISQFGKYEWKGRRTR